MIRLRHLLPIATALTAFGLAPASAGPDGPAVVGGAATVVNPGSANVTVNQTTDKAIVNWRLFDVGANDHVRFNQPNSGSVILNRVTGGLGPSQILGSIDANGRVFVVNRDGILFGPNAVINTAGFLATTHDIRNEDFMAGRFKFDMPGRPDASIVNLGTITATNGGFAALVAPGVRNSGTITATLGNVTLAAGNGFSLDFYGDKLVTLNVGDQIASSVRDVATGLPLKALVGNDGKIKADGGRVELTAVAARQVVDAVINTSGVIEANTVGTRNGMIVLGAATRTTKPAGAPAQVVKVSGTLKAAGKQTGPADRGGRPGSAKGGTIVVTGENIQVAGANIDVSGDNGGGKVLIGGDWGGGKPDTSLVSNPSAVLESFSVPTASTVSVDAATRIDASAIQNGNGGKVIVWSDQTTSFAGTILALGGREFGNGGFAEVSSHGLLTYAGVVDLRASNGKAGTLLLDPQNVDIVNGGAGGSTNGSFSGGAGNTWTPNDTPSNVTVADIINQLGLGNLIITTSSPNAGPGPGNITVNANVALNTPNTLTLIAHNDITITGGVKISNTGSGNLVLRADSDADGLGRVILNPGTFPERIDWSGSTGRVSIYYNPIGGYTTPSNYLTGFQTGPTGPTFAGGTVAVNSGVPNQFTAYMLVNSVINLQAISSNPGGTYALGRDINATGFTGFGVGTHFTSGFIFDGNGGLGSNQTISNLTLSSNQSPIGLFPFLDFGAAIRNLNLSNVSITHTGTSQTIMGPLVGMNSGTISNVHVLSGTVNGGLATGVIAGGLVGQNGTFGPGGHPGIITGSSANVTVTVGDGLACPGSCNFNIAGGLAGSNTPGSTIIDSQTFGNVTAGANTFAGGLVGQNSGTILGTTTPPAATTTACATGASWSCAGGPVNVGASAHAGGLVGESNGIIINAFATGNVTGAPGLSNINNSGDPTNLGGLVGQNQGLIATSFATGNVGTPNVANLNVGGLVGENSGWIVASAAFGLVRAGDNSVAGGLVGNNSPFDNGCNCSPGDGSPFFNKAVLIGSTAFGDVTVGSMSLAGGFVGASNGFLMSNSAVGNVTGAGNTFLGGFAGVAGYQDGLGIIGFATASGSVNSTGPNSVVGGLVGGNMNPIVSSSASGPVAGTSDSFLGGLVGINLAKITDSSTSSTATVTASGANNIMGGLVGMNVGWIDPSTSAGNVTGGPNSIVGGFVGANTTFTNFAPGTVPGSSFPVGTISPDSFGTGTATGGPGSTVSPQVASNNPSGSAPAYPSPIQSCDAAGCVILKTGTFGPGADQGDHNTVTVPPLLTLTQQLTKDPADNKTSDPVPNTTTTTTTATPGGPKPGGPGPGPGKPPAWFGPNAVLPTGMPPLTETRYRNDEVMLQLGNGTAEQVADIARKLGLEILAMEDVGLLGRKVYRFRLTGGLSVRDAIKALEANKFAAQAQPVYVFELAQAPAGNETMTRGDSAQYIVAKLRLPEVHTLATGKDVLVAVVDSTIDVNHPDLSGVIAQRFDAVGAELAPHPHGTGMAGAIASHTRLLGVAPNARLLAIHAFGVQSGGAQGTSLAIVKGLNWAVEQGAKVINMSFAGPRDPILEQAIKGLREKGIVLIAAAGNAGPKSPPLFPGADPNVIAVSATDADDAVYKNANRGKYVAIAAPGVDILVPAPDGGYQLTTGTSVAAAHVSGVAALLLERNPNLKPDELKRILTSTAAKLKGARPEDVGAGLVAPYDALVKIAPKTATVH